MKTRYTVAESAVKERDGDGYSLDNYKYGYDYVTRKCFKSFKHMFRSDILGFSIVDLNLVEHKQDPQPLINEVKLVKILRQFPNPNFIETTEGVIKVGKLGLNLKRGQVIKIKGGLLVT
jgi:hypothetical protein